MTYNPETAERLAATLEKSYFIRTPKLQAVDLERARAAALIRAQAAEIERLKQGMVDLAMTLNKTAEHQVRAALQEARNAALREAAEIVRTHNERWTSGSGTFDLQPRIEGSRSGLAYADAILALIDTTAPNQPAGDALYVDRALIEYDPDGWKSSVPSLRAAATTHTAAGGKEMTRMVCPVCRRGDYAWLQCQYPGCTDGRSLIPDQPTPQPDAEEREALIAFLKDAVNKKPADGKPYDHMADALIAAGWPRNREDASRLRDCPACKGNGLDDDMPGIVVCTVCEGSGVTRNREERK